MYFAFYYVIKKLVPLNFILKYTSAHFRRITPNLKSFRVNRMLVKNRELPVNRLREEIEQAEIRTPHFAHLSETKIKANVGSTITLNCRVRNSDNYTVRK